MNLDSKQLFSADDINELRRLINEELARRCYEGSLKSYATKDDFSEKNRPQQEKVALEEQHNNLLLSLERIVGSNYSFQTNQGWGQPPINWNMPNMKLKGNKINSIKVMHELVKKLHNEELGTNYSSCNHYCSGLCKTTCTTQCGSSCSGNCSATCADDCTNSCVDTCLGSCHAQCAGGCGVQCTNSDGCFGPCKNRCTCPSSKIQQ